MYMLEVKDVSVFYGKAIALNGLSMDLKPKELVGVVGPNGAGKSTLLRAISAVVPMDGQILFNGERIDQRQPHEVVRMGIIHCPERRQIFMEFTMAENLEMGAFLRKDKDGIKKDLEYVYNLFPKLKQRKKQISGTLSGGEQQLLAMGRGLMAKPKLIMLDEPSLGLAPLYVKEVFEIIQRINKEGVSVLLVEQNVRSSLKLADRGYVLESGKITMSGTGKELLENENIKKAYLAG